VLKIDQYVTLGKKAFDEFPDFIGVIGKITDIDEGIHRYMIEWEVDWPAEYYFQEDELIPMDLYTMLTMKMECEKVPVTTVLNMMVDFLEGKALYNRQEMIDLLKKTVVEQG
jgi:hypothetical protein